MSRHGSSYSLSPANHQSSPLPTVPPHRASPPPSTGSQHSSSPSPPLSAFKHSLGFFTFSGGPSPHPSSPASFDAAPTRPVCRWKKSTPCSARRRVYWLLPVYHERCARQNSKTDTRSLVRSRISRRWKRPERRGSRSRGLRGLLMENMSESDKLKL